jgi:hypothetical protein
LYKPFETKVVVLKATIENLAEWALSKGTNYKILVKLNPWILGNKLSVRSPLKILLPKAGFNLKPYGKSN